MVSTRHHPSDFPPPPTPSSPPSSSTCISTNTGKRWMHTPATAVTLWLVFSTPLVLWDVAYVLLRPHSMPGNKLHSPIWIPYALYGTVDYIYGWPAFNDRNGFTAAQSVLNLVETVAYIYYLVAVYRYGDTVASNGRGSQRKTKKGLRWFLGEEKVVSGRAGAIALMVAFSASLVTLSKTILYCKLCGCY